jgi:predicted ATPase
MRPCDCSEVHKRRRVVLTGGPGAGKTAVLELIRQYFCKHVMVLPETAGIVYGGGFPRSTLPEVRQAAQRAIYHVQRELETAAETSDSAVILCDRGTVDGSTYWVGSGDLWSSVGTTLQEQIARYDTVIHLRTPGPQNGYNYQNPLRIETPEDAAIIDERILHAWESHPRRFVIEPSANFLSKAARALEILRAEMPECCRKHVIPIIDGPAQNPQRQ